MSKHYFFAANWKMNLNIDQELNYASSNYDKLIKLSEKNNASIILCPSFVSIYPLNKIFSETKISIGAQNCSSHLKGSYTGQISAESLCNLGCKYCIIGHSERREYNKETDDDISQKFNQLINFKISPIICVGEKLKEHEQQDTINILTKQLQKIFDLIKNNLLIPNKLPVLIAYEPVWSIGTGKIPSQDHLETIFTWLYLKTQKEAPNINWKFLYGGSLSSQNVDFFKKINNLEGFLIGKSSLDFQEFEKIVEL